MEYRPVFPAFGGDFSFDEEFAALFGRFPRQSLREKGESWPKRGKVFAKRGEGWPRRGKVFAKGWGGLRRYQELTGAKLPDAEAVVRAVMRRS